MLTDLIRSKKLSTNEKVLLLVLLTWEVEVQSGDKMDIHPNQTTLAEQCNMSKKSIVRTLSSLRKKKLVTTVKKVDRSSLVYKLAPKVVETISPNGRDRMSSGWGQIVPVDNIINNNNLSTRGTNSPNLLVFDELEYPVAISGLIFDSPGQLGQHVKEHGNKKEFLRSLTDQLRVCKCGKKVIGCDICKECKSKPVKKNGKGPQWNSIPEDVRELIKNIGG